MTKLRSVILYGVRLHAVLNTFAFLLTLSSVCLRGVGLRAVLVSVEFDSSHC